MVSHYSDSNVSELYDKDVLEEYANEGQKLFNWLYNNVSQTFKHSESRVSIKDNKAFIIPESKKWNSVLKVEIKLPPAFSDESLTTTFLPKQVFDDCKEFKVKDKKGERKQIISEISLEDGFLLNISGSKEDRENLVEEDFIYFLQFNEQHFNESEKKFESVNEIFERKKSDIVSVYLTETIIAEILNNDVTILYLSKKHKTLKTSSRLMSPSIASCQFLVMKSLLKKFSNKDVITVDIVQEEDYFFVKFIFEDKHLYTEQIFKICSL
jgi:hypothetical protein